MGAGFSLCFTNSTKIPHFFHTVSKKDAYNTVIPNKHRFFPKGKPQTFKEVIIMLKRTLTIVIASLLICSLAACSQASETTEANTMAAKSVVTSSIDTATDDGQVSEETNAGVVITEEETDESDVSGSEDSETSKSDTSTSSDTSKNTSTADSKSKTTAKSSTVDSSAKQSGTTSNTANNGTSGNTNTANTSNSTSNNAQTGSTLKEANPAAGTSVSSYTPNTSGKLDTTDLFSKRDLTQSLDLTGSATIQAADNKTVTISEEGIYILKGSASNFTIRVEADKQSKVQIVLDGATITNDNFPVIYVVSADKCFVTTTSSVNTLSVTGTFRADGDTNTDAVIFSKDDLVLNGTGTLNITSNNGNGISGKDDIKITGGTYKITCAKDAVEANDSIAVYDGSFEINTSKDAFHSENEDDDTVGWVYIRSGQFNLRAGSDGVQATTVVQIDGGSFTINAPEGIEATYVQINDGTIQITSSDDGINASQKSRSLGTPTVEFNGGNTTIVMGQGDTDAVDANGNIIVNGGTINITAQMSSFDYDGTAQYNGGTIIINGTQVDSIPQSMMGGRGGMGGRGAMNNMNGSNGTNNNFGGFRGRF